MNNIKDNELFREMYYKLFNEVTNIEEEVDNNDFTFVFGFSVSFSVAQSYT